MPEAVATVGREAVGWEEGMQGGWAEERGSAAAVVEQGEVAAAVGVAAAAGREAEAVGLAKVGDLVEVGAAVAAEAEREGEKGAVVAAAAGQD